MATPTKEKTVSDAKPRAARPAAATPAPRRGSFGRARNYLMEVWTELKKASWPTKQELIASTQVVIALLIVVGLFIAAWDWILTSLFRLIDPK